MSMFTFLIAALTADGCIAKNSLHTPLSWRSKEDREFFIARTRKAGVVVMGLNTYKTMRRPMPERLNVVYANAGEVSPAPGVEVTQKAPAELLKDLEQRGYNEVAICGGSTIYTMFMSAGVVDKLYLTVEPIIFGSGMKLFNKEIDAKLILGSMQKIGENTILLEYNICK